MSTIFCLIGQLGTGGTEKQMYLFLKYLDRNRYDPIVIIGNYSTEEWTKKIKSELTGWIEENNYPFSIYGVGSHLGYEFTEKPGQVYKSCRDMLSYSNEDYMQTFAFEMANRGIFPMYRGQITLSVPMTEADIDIFISTSKNIISGILADD